MHILDTLSKFSHDADPEVSYNSIFAMGMVGSGTNNARLAVMLRQLAQYHAKDPNNLFMVRLAQVMSRIVLLRVSVPGEVSVWWKGDMTLCEGDLKFGLERRMWMSCEICVAELGDFSLDVTSLPPLLSVFFSPRVWHI